MEITLRELRLAKPWDDDSEDDRADAIKQVEAQQEALVNSRQLFENLLSGIRTAVNTGGETRVVNNFGSQKEGEGQKIEVNYEPIVFNPTHSNM